MKPPDWRVSSYSFANGNCVEVLLGGPLLLVRDTKNRGGVVLGFSADAWRRFVADTKAPRVAR